MPESPLFVALFFDCNTDEKLAQVTWLISILKYKIIFNKVGKKVYI